MCQILKWKKVQRVRFWIKKNTMRRFLNWQIFVLSCTEIKVSQRVRLFINNLRLVRFRTRNFSFFIPKFWPSPITCTFHIVFLHIIMPTYSPQYLHQVDNRIHYRSNKTSCPLFCNDIEFWIRCGVPLYSLYGLDKCRNLLLLKILTISILQLLLSETCPNSFWKKIRYKKNTVSKIYIKLHTR